MQQLAYKDRHYENLEPCLRYIFELGIYQPVMRPAVLHNALFTILSPAYSIAKPIKLPNSKPGC
jgi:hypothetical protein